MAVPRHGEALARVHGDQAIEAGEVARLRRGAQARDEVGSVDRLGPHGQWPVKPLSRPPGCPRSDIGVRVRALPSGAPSGIASDACRGADTAPQGSAISSDVASDVRAPDRAATGRDFSRAACSTCAIRSASTSSQKPGTSEAASSRAVMRSPSSVRAFPPHPLCN